MFVTRKARTEIFGLSTAIIAALLAGCVAGGGTAAAPGAATPDRAPAGTAKAAAPTATYWAYVGAESADLIHRIRFGPDGAAVEKTTPVGELVVETEGPHGLNITRDGRYLLMTTGHGAPFGKLWKFDLGPDTLVGAPVELGDFPATVDVSPDGLYAFAVNFKLHGEHIPSTVSVVYLPDMVEVARTTTCTMPHGSRLDPQGIHHYSACMMDDQLVEIDAATFEVTRRFSVARGAEGPIPVEATADHPATRSAGAAPHQGAQHDAAAHRDAAHDDAAHAEHMKDPQHAAMHAQMHAAAPSGDAGASAGAAATHAAAAPSCSPTWAQPSVDGRSVYVACNKANEILEISVAEWRVTRRFPTGAAPYNLAVTPDGRTLVATLKKDAAIQVFDLGSGESRGTAQASTTVTHGVAVSPDSRYAFVSSEGVGSAPGKVDIFDLGTLTRVGSVDVGQQAGGIIFWKMQPAPHATR